MVLAVMLAAAVTVAGTPADTPSAGPEPRPGLLVRPILGAGLAAGDAGMGIDLELGLRVERALVRISAAYGGSMDNHFFCGLNDDSHCAPNHWYAREALHLDGIAFTRGSLLFFGGLGAGRLRYGEHPTEDLTARSYVLIPEAGLIWSPPSAPGRLFVQLQGNVPISSRPSSSPTDPDPSRPVIMLSAIISL